MGDTHDDDVMNPDVERESETEDFTTETTRPAAAAAADMGDLGPGDAVDVSDVDIDGDLSGDSDDADGAAAVEHDVDELVAEVERFKDMAVRVQADFENFRKRAAQQTAEEVDRATGRMAEAFLPIIDAAEAAYVGNPDEVGPLLNALLVELKKLGLETLDIAGSAFDPTTAEAVAHEPGDGGEVVVAEVLRSGYLWKGRTLRPAMVRTRD